MGYCYNLEHEAKEPFETLDEITTKHIIDSIGGDEFGIIDFLSDAADTQVAGVVNCDMQECEVWHYGVMFVLENADNFKHGYKAFILKFQDVYYIFICPSKDGLLARIKKEIKKDKQNDS